MWALALGMAGVPCAGCRKDIKSKQSSQDGGFTPPPGDKAGGMDEAALARVRAIATDKPPAAIRPDPDLYVRRLLRQYRDEGPLVAREIGRV